MKILVIDYLSYNGHRNFNRIHLDVFLKLGHNLTLVGKTGHFDEYKDNPKVSIIYPSILDNVKPEDSHFKNISNLLEIKKQVKVSDYDIILFPTYDVASLFVFRTKMPTYVIDHNTVGMLNNSLFGRIRLFLTKTLPSNYYHICLNKSMETRLRELDRKHKVFHIPHGICPPAMNLAKPDFLNENQHFIFCPINRNYDSDFVQSIFESSRLGEYLESNNMVLLVKDGIPCNCQNKNIIRIENGLSKPQYDYLIQKAKAIILPYGQRFVYRCSGIFFECISRKTPVIATDLEEFRQYKENTDLYLFNNVAELLDKITLCIHNGSREFNNDVFNPRQYWEKTLAASISL